MTNDYVLRPQGTAVTRQSQTALFYCQDILADIAKASLEGQIQLLDVAGGTREELNAAVQRVADKIIEATARLQAAAK